jgi:hypothetical protein
MVCGTALLLATTENPPLQKMSRLGACQCRKDTSWLTKVTKKRTAKDKTPAKDGRMREEMR